MKRQASFTDSAKALSNVIALRAFMLDYLTDGEAMADLDARLAGLQHVILSRLQEHVDQTGEQITIKEMGK